MRATPWIDASVAKSEDVSLSDFPRILSSRTRRFDIIEL